MDAKLRVGIYSGRTPEQMAVELGTKPSYIYTLMRRRLGFVKMLLDEPERQMIERRRYMMLNPPKRSPRPKAKGRT